MMNPNSFPPTEELEDSSKSKGKKTRNQILEAALNVASKRGLSGLTIGELAKSVGMSKSGLFAHFRTKDALELAVLEAAVERFVDMVLTPSFKMPKGEPRILALIENWVTFLNGSNLLPGGSILIAASVELDDRPGPARDFVQKAQRDLITNLEKSARIAVEAKHFRKDLDCEQFSWSLYSFVLGYHHFSRMLNDPKAEWHFRRSVSGLLNFAKTSVSRTAETNKRIGKAKRRGGRLPSQKDAK
jgi:AcrR family transcriptional regulator